MEKEKKIKTAYSAKQHNLKPRGQPLPSRRPRGYSNNRKVQRTTGKPTNKLLVNLNRRSIVERSVENYLGSCIYFRCSPSHWLWTLFDTYQSLNRCFVKIMKLKYAFPWLLSPDYVRITDEASEHGPCSFF